ncbi:DUF805 domain-containing protein [Raineyella fluvialis]|uniref:DUF805 domain-containing protein n=1 Tax=Raineyella fluvialis TaxID=2662261 RepID=A0A5Q2FCQ7_9ACTN|nr:DUF805 domain-containing protein [Raineyella fluvialis]QGF23214.1 DUF805 domain-containing protein [Raineyella fluvialis]
MGFSEAITTGFRKYVDFSGRATRAEFWYWVLFAFVVDVVASILDNVLGLGQMPVISGLVSLALLLPGIAVAVRRLHDLGRSGWVVLLNLVPVLGGLFLIFAFYIKDSQAADNAYGPNPKAAVPAADAETVEQDQVPTV